MLRIKKFQSGGKNDFVRKELELLYKLGYFGNVPYNKAVDGYYGNMTRAAEEAAIRDGRITREQLNAFKRYSSIVFPTSLLSSSKGSSSYKGYTIRGNPSVFKLQVDLMGKGLLKESDLDGMMGPKTRDAISRDKGFFQRVAESVGKSTTSIKKGAVKVKREDKKAESKNPTIESFEEVAPYAGNIFTAPFAAAYIAVKANDARIENNSQQYFGTKPMGVKQSREAAEIAREAAQNNLDNPLPLIETGNTSYISKDNDYRNKSDEEIRDIFKKHKEKAIHAITSNKGSVREIIPNFHFLNEALNFMKISKNNSNAVEDAMKGTLAYYDMIIENPSLARTSKIWKLGCIMNNTHYLQLAAKEHGANGNIKHYQNRGLVSQIKALGNSGQNGYVIVTDGSRQVGDLIALGRDNATHNLMQIGPDLYVQQHADSPGYGDKTIVDLSYLNSIAATEGRDIYGNGLNNGITNVRPIDYILGKAWLPIKRFISGEGSAGKGYYRIRYVGTPADRTKWSQ